MKQLPIIPLGPSVNWASSINLASDALNRTIQGEGIYAGIPSLFLRLQGCNLTCAKCDTKHTWHPDRTAGGQVLDIQRILEQVVANLAGIDHLVITGGEPMLQQEALRALVKGVRSCRRDVAITVETNGTQDVQDWHTLADLVSFSPKLPLFAADSRGYIDRICQAAGIEQQLKLVVEDRLDLEYACDTIDDIVRLGAVLREHCFIQPEWSVGGANIKWMADYCISRNVRIGTQQHKTWGLP